MFHVGQKVACVEPCESWKLYRGAVYTVSTVGIYCGEPHVDVLETVQSCFPLAWHVRRFRPVVERKTDISVFEALLTPAGKPKVTV